MTLRLRAGGIPVESGGPHLGRWCELRMAPFHGGLAVWNGRLLAYSGGGFGGGTSAEIPNCVFGQGSLPTVATVDGQRALLFQAGAGAGDYRTAIISRAAGDALFTQFRDTVPPRLGDPFSGRPLATVAQAWLRKANNVDATHCVTAFMFHMSSGNIGTDRAARMGLFGDGATGMRFGSIRAPDGAAAFVNLVGNEIDAGSVQPVALVNPGLNWFHVRIKVIPAINAATPGRWLAYLNGELVATFTTVANFARGDLGVNQSYLSVAHMISTGHALAVQTNGLYVSDWTYWLDEDLSA